MDLALLLLVISAYCIEHSSENSFSQYCQRAQVNQDYSIQLQCSGTDATITYSVPPNPEEFPKDVIGLIFTCNETITVDLFLEQKLYFTNTNEIEGVGSLNPINLTDINVLPGMDCKAQGCVRNGFADKLALFANCTIPFADDCTWLPWSNWSACNCENETQVTSREQIAGDAGGEECIGNFTDSRPCVCQAEFEDSESLVDTIRSSVIPLTVLFVVSVGLLLGVLLRGIQYHRSSKRYWKLRHRLYRPKYAEVLDPDFEPSISLETTVVRSHSCQSLFHAFSIEGMHMVVSQRDMLVTEEVDNPVSVKEVNNIPVSVKYPKEAAENADVHQDIQQGSTSPSSITSERKPANQCQSQGDSLLPKAGSIVPAAGKQCVATSTNNNNTVNRHGETTTAQEVTNESQGLESISVPQDTRIATTLHPGYVSDITLAPINENLTEHKILSCSTENLNKETSCTIDNEKPQDVDHSVADTSTLDLTQSPRRTLLKVTEPGPLLHPTSDGYIREGHDLADMSCEDQIVMDELLYSTKDGYVCRGVGVLHKDLPMNRYIGHYEPDGLAREGDNQLCSTIPTKQLISHENLPVTQRQLLCSTRARDDTHEPVVCDTDLEALLPPAIARDGYIHQWN